MPAGAFLYLKITFRSSNMPAGAFLYLKSSISEQNTKLFQEMCAPLTRNHTFSRNVCPSCTKPYFSEKCVPLLHETTLFRCVPLLHETILFCKNTEIRTRGYVNNSRNLPTSRTQRTQGRNIPVQGNPSLRPPGPRVPVVGPKYRTTKSAKTQQKTHTFVVCV